MAEETPDVEQAGPPDPGAEAADVTPTPAKGGADSSVEGGLTAEQLASEAIDKAEQAVDAIQAEASAPATPEGAMVLPDLGSTSSESGDTPAGLALLRDVDLHVTVELGRTRMYVEDVLRLNESSIIELDKLAGDPVEIYVNNRHVARGEVLVLNDNFCVRISEIIEPASQG